MQRTYVNAWPRVMKIGQIDVLSAVTRSKIKTLGNLSLNDSFKDEM